MIQPMALNWNVFNFSKRDVVCLGIALGVHSLLLLWTASSLSIMKNGKDLGESIVEIGFMTDVPAYDLGGQSQPAKDKSLFGQVKKFFGSEAKPAGDSGLATGGDAQKIENSKPNWEIAKKDLVEKDFKNMKSFSSLKKSDEMLMAQGESNKVNIKKGEPEFLSNEPQLKSKTNRISPLDSPFAIKKAKDVDALSNVNAVPVNVGNTTSPSIKSFSAYVGGEKLKGKSLSGGNTSGNFGSPSGASQSGGLIAMGGSSNINPALATGGTLASATNSSGNSGSQGRTAGRTGSGTSFSGGTSMATLPRNTVSGGGGGDSVSSGGGGSGNKAFDIRGALSGRAILNNPLPKITEDIRATFKFYVDWAGRVLDGIVTIAGSGNPSIDRELMDALSKWIFAQLPKNRVNEIQEGEITFRFIGR